MREDIKAQYPGFTITCDNCKSKEIIVENTIGFSELSGAWGEVELVCNSCGNRAVIFEPL